MAWSNLQKGYYQNKDTKKAILGLKSKGLSIRQIAKTTGISKSAIHRFLKKIKERPNYFHLSGI